VETDRQVQRAIAIGEANKRVLELVQNWCAHVTVKKQGWGGLLEQMSGLPIGLRSLTCPHASAAGFSGMDLKFIALDFHDRNCVGCTHRKPVRLPNLSELVHARDQAAAASAAASAHRDAAEAYPGGWVSIRTFTRESIFLHILEISLQQSACSAKFSWIRRRRREIFGETVGNLFIPDRIIFRSGPQRWASIPSRSVTMKSR
jgi:hypothetical protein